MTKKYKDDGLEFTIYKSLYDVDRKTRYVLGSGSVQRNEDIVTSKYLIQCKNTMKSKYSIDIRDIHRLFENAKMVGKIPIIIVRLKKSSSYKYYIYEVMKVRDVKYNVSDGNGYILLKYSLIYIGDINSFINRVKNEL